MPLLNESPTLLPEVNVPPDLKDTELNVLLRLESILKAQCAPRKFLHGRIISVSDDQIIQFPSDLFFYSITFFADPANGGAIRVGDNSVDVSNCPPMNANAEITPENRIGSDIFLRFANLGDVMWWEGEVLR
jgi:hypothetical protein